MEKIHIWDVVSLLGISMPSGKSSFNVSCPNCDEDPHSKHLNINLKKEVFRCPRCGVSGGIFDLYSLYSGVPRDKARDAILKGMGVSPEQWAPRRKVKPIFDEVKENPLADIETRHATYLALLSKLSLSEDHKENLLNRGLTEEAILRLGYKTAPAMGFSSFARQLRSAGCYLSGVPGFFRDKEKNWSLTELDRGILIPTRDEEGRIQGLQIRLDKTEKRKFRWVSSNGLDEGCPALTWTHMAGKVRPMLILTEGPMKADVIHELTGLSVLAVPGVNALGQLELTLKRLKKAGVEEIKTAFDMDYLSNYHVQNGYQALYQLLTRMGFQFGTYLWDPRFKGLDDYIWEYCFQRKGEK